MRISNGVILSINENAVDISSGWLWSTAEVYSLDYQHVLVQPVSVEAVVLNELRFLANTTTLTIRAEAEDGSMVLWAGEVDTEPDPPAPAPTPEEGHPQAVAGVAMVKDTLVALNSASELVRADSVLGLETIGVALNSADAGGLIAYSTYGEVDVLTFPFTAGSALYLGENGNMSLTPPYGSTLTQRVGTATATGVIIQVQQSLHLA